MDPTTQAPTNQNEHSSDHSDWFSGVGHVTWVGPVRTSLWIFAGPVIFHPPLSSNSPYSSEAHLLASIPLVSAEICHPVWSLDNCLPHELGHDCVLIWCHRASIPFVESSLGGDFAAQ